MGHVQHHNQQYMFVSIHQCAIPRDAGIVGSQDASSVAIAGRGTKAVYNACSRSCAGSLIALQPDYIDDTHNSQEHIVDDCYICSPVTAGAGQEEPEKTSRP